MKNTRPSHRFMVCYDLSDILNGVENYHRMQATDTARVREKPAHSDFNLHNTMIEVIGKVTPASSRIRSQHQKILAVCESRQEIKNIPNLENKSKDMRKYIHQNDRLVLKREYFT